ncbi:MAG: hypothetical protein WDO71_08665 [Bacteroidota bacterium]
MESLLTITGAKEISSRAKSFPTRIRFLFTIEITADVLLPRIPGSIELLPVATCRTCLEYRTNRMPNDRKLQVCRAHSRNILYPGRKSIVGIRQNSNGLWTILQTLSIDDPLTSIILPLPVVWSVQGVIPAFQAKGLVPTNILGTEYIRRRRGKYIER